MDPSNAHTHCTTCYEAAKELMLEGMAECIMDDENVDYDEAVKRVTPEALHEQVIDYLDQIVYEQRESGSSHPENTCFFVHTDHL